VKRVLQRKNLRLNALLLRKVVDQHKGLMPVRFDMAHHYQVML
jgi:hypothetical protein